MKGITTQAAIPSGAGQAAHLPAEVGEARYATGGYVTPSTYTAIPQVQPGGKTVTITFNIGDDARAALKAALMASPVRKYARECRAKIAEPAFTPFSTVTVIDQSPESIARLIEVTSPVKYEMRECVLSDDPTTLILSRGHAMTSGAPRVYISDARFAEFRRIVTTDETIARQLSDAGYCLTMWMDINIGIGWEVQRNGRLSPTETPPTPADKQGFEPPEYAERN